MRYMTTIDGMLKALADPVRLSIVGFLARPEAECCTKDDRVCACDLVDITGLSQPTISHHMRILVAAGLVATEWEGRWVHYRLRRSRFSQLVDHLARFGLGDVRTPCNSASAPPPKGVTPRA